MAVLRYWDAGSSTYIALTGPPGPPGSSAAYFPPQAPPVSGFNTFTDASGEIWVSRNGSAWKKARDVLHCKVNRTAAWTIGTAAAVITFDTAIKDDYAMWNGGVGLVTPIAGWYATHMLLSATITSAFLITLQAYRAAGATRVGYITGNTSAAGGGWVGVVYQVNNYLNAAETVQFNAQSSVAATTGGTSELCTAGMSFIGTG